MKTYHEALRDRSAYRPSTVVEEERRRTSEPTVAELTDRLEAQEQQVADVGDHLGYPSGEIPVDDGRPPLSPTGLAAVSYMHEVDLSWTTPPVSDYVVSSRIYATPQGSSAPLVFEGSPLDGGASNLTGGVSHTFTVTLVDRWGREGAPSAPVTATPLLNASEQIDLDVLAAGQRISGMLPGANLAQITDPGKLGETAVKLVAQNANKNLLPYNESSPDHFDPGPWELTGPGKHTYSDASMSVEASGWWLQSVGAAGGGFVYAFGASDYQVRDGEYYILSATARNPLSTAVGAQIVPVCYNAAGAVLQSFAPGYTAVNAGDTTRLFAKFQVPTGTSSVRYYLQIQTPSGAMEWTAFQLERVGATVNAPTPYAVPAIFTGALGANLVAALDVLGVRGVFKDASIESAKAKSIVADKIDSGTITAAVIRLMASGKLQAGATVLDAGGITLPRTAGYSTSAQNRDYKISTPDNLTAYSFYNNAPIEYGAQVRSDGYGGVKGTIALQSTRAGDYSAVSSAGLEVNSGDSASQKGFVVVEGDLKVVGQLIAYSVGNAGTIAANTSASWNLTLPGVPGIIAVQVQTYAGGYWAPVAWSGSLYVDYCTATTLKVVNNTASAYVVRAYLYY